MGKDSNGHDTARAPGKDDNPKAQDQRAAINREHQKRSALDVFKRSSRRPGLDRYDR